MKLIHMLIIYQLVFFTICFSDVIPVNKNVSQLQNNKTAFSLKNELDKTTPSGNGKALLLLPFQHEFKENRKTLERYFNNAGYKTEVYEDGDANIDKFRGSFLADFDVVYISTHGHNNIGLSKTDNKKFAPQIVVGINSIEIDRKAFDKLTLEEQQATGRIDEGAEGSFGLSAKWFKITSNGKSFKNTWVYLNACHSAGVTSGENSFSETFLELGAAAFNGYSDFIIIPLSNAISEATIAIFTSGSSFNQMNKKVKSSLRLKFIQMRIYMNARESRKKYADINLFVSKKGITDDFYLK
ncbi:hypothetical protein [Tenacibaculum aquimarinum]|uniref:hypothetical protein n=1 Tax=Tenacibaculum aquimarinum TaxID=2910675 RepID=UPI001F0A0FC3|nr:hypothetical protein [Tenacibaculum aquimarinum]MCH3885787.1 hypothetical protein [Tenacibaculum aquimarinum]